MLACFAGTILTFQFAWGLAKFGGLEYVSRVAALSISRVVAATVVFNAGLFAWITWAHDVEAALVRERFRGTALRVALAAPLAYAFSALVASMAGFFVGSIAFGISLETWLADYGTSLLPLDWVYGMGATITGVAVLIVAAWFVMPRLSSVSWGLGRKLAVAFGAIVLLRVVVSLGEAVWDAALPESSSGLISATATITAQ